MISTVAKGWVSKLLLPVGRALGRTPLTPDVLTVIGLLLNVGVACIIAYGYIFAGGWLVLVAGAFDMLDGAVARATNRVSAFGAFLDSTLDRYSEAILYFGIIVLYTQQGRHDVVWLAYAAIIGSLMVSYSRARAEGIGLKGEVGMFARTERIVVLAAGLIFGQMLIALWVLAVITNFTAAQRVVFVWRQTRKPTTRRAGEASPKWLRTLMRWTA